MVPPGAVSPPATPVFAEDEEDGGGSSGGLSPRYDERNADGSSGDDDNDNDDDEDGFILSLQDRVIQVVASESRSTSGLLAASGSGSPVEAEEELQRRDDPFKGRTGTGRRRTFITVHPARVAALLGISVEDATAELCSLLAAVGGGHGGASFAFVKLSTPDGSNPRQREEKGHIPAEPNQGVPGPVSMVFSFPPDFQTRVRSSRRKSHFWKLAHQLALFGVRALKIATALGLLLSVLIVTVAALVGAVAALVAWSRFGGGGGGSTRAAPRNDPWIRNSVRSLCETLRQLLWCYAVFGPTVGDGYGGGGDPFLREVAADLSMLCSCCYRFGNPYAVWYWAHAARRRSRRRCWLTRPWFGVRRRSRATDGSTEAELAPLHPIARTGEWSRRNIARDSSDRLLNGGDELPVFGSESPSTKGLLGIAVEFLFGPTPFARGPSHAERWKLRALVILDRCSSSDDSDISLAQLAPFADQPPRSLDDARAVVEQGLRVVSHFHGIPSRMAECRTPNAQEANINASADGSPSSAFIFPELMAESTFLSTSMTRSACSENEQPWTRNLLFETESPESPSPSTSHSKLPVYLRERPYRFTLLNRNQFAFCTFLVLFNFLGVQLLRHAVVRKGGVLEMDAGRTPAWLYILVLHIILPVLHFYSVLFLVLPIGRLVHITYLNIYLQRRNDWRQSLHQALPHK